MTDYFDRIEAHLLDAVEQHAAHRRLGRRPHAGVLSGVGSRVRHAGLGLAVAVPVLVAVATIALLGHRLVS